MEELHVGEEFFFGIVGEGHGASRCEGTLALVEKFEDSVLDNFGVHHERRQILAFAQVVEHGVCHIAHT